ncbi:hypothetical protein ACROYT_G001280 [Oculina patagonica]
MARVKTLIIVGRFVVFALMVMQCFFLASYPAFYEDKGAWYAISLFFVPAAVMWWWINSNTAVLWQVGVFWMVYIWLGVVPLTGIAFGRTGDIIKSKGFWNASTLKLTLCITPLLLFLICHTKIASREVRVGQISEWSAKALINLFDGIELIAVILDENECSYGIPRDFKNTLIAFTCISFLWWPVGMALDHEAAEQDRDEQVDVFRYSIQVLFDTIFLGLRMGLSLGYGKNASIFISKNMIFIIVHSRRIFKLFFGSDDSDDDSTVEQQQAESSEPSMPSSSSPAVSLENNPRFINVLGFNSPPVANPEPTAPPPFNPRRTDLTDGMSLSYVVS